MKILVLLYGVICYFFGVSALLGWLAAMEGLLPFNLAKIEYTGTTAYLGAIVLMGLFALQHTIMARPGFKARLTSVIPVAAERPTFMLFTGLFLWIVLLCWPVMPDVIWQVENQTLSYALIGFSLFGFLYLFIASFAINHFELFGLHQVFNHFTGKPLPNVPFKENLMYKFDRHPIMTGVLIVIWSTPKMTMDHLLFSILLTLYIIMGVSFEERDLRDSLGQTYGSYANRVRTIVPTFLKG